MRTINSPEVRRNMGFWSEDVQQALLDTEVAIAGNGGTGNLLGMQLARIGIQRFSIADPEDFDDVNSNRVMGARAKTIGKNKAEVLRDDILEINPSAKVVVYNQGIDMNNIDYFLSNAGIVINGLELKKPELAVMLARKARSRKIGGKDRPVPMVDVEYIGHAGQGTVFCKDKSISYEKFMGIKGGENASLEEIANQYIDVSRWLTYIPSYGDLRTLQEVINGSPLPSNMIGAGVASQIGVSEVLRIIREKIGEKGIKPTYAPNVRFYDAYSNKSGQTCHPRASYYWHVGKVIVNNALKLNETSSYTKDEREARGDLD